MIPIGSMPDPLPEPERGHVVIVEHIPTCNFNITHPEGRWDVKTRMGPWANLCDDCARKHALYPTTGVGKGQLWVKSSIAT